jgi:quinolinate synthase
MHIWMGECHVHAGIRTHELIARQKALPAADLLIHPECGCTSAYIYDMGRGKLPENTFVLSTEGMVKHAAKAQTDTFLVATETGILHRLQKEMPGKRFLPADDSAVCRYMKQITLQKLHDTLRDMRPEVDVPPEIAAKARLSIERMLAIRP